MRCQTPIPFWPRRFALPVLLAAVLPVAGCKVPFLGDDGAAKAVEEGKAVGSACRHALRGIEDCYNQYPKADKPAIFTGWKEMDEYMRENKIEGKATPPRPAASEPDEEDETGQDAAPEAKKSKAKP